VPVADAPPAASPPPKSATARRFTPEQKAEAVRLADELGSDSEAARQSGTTSVSLKTWRKSGTTSVSLKTWRKSGHGKRPKSVNGTAENRGAKRADAHEGPQVKCPVCNAKVPIVGEPGVESRATAIREHYKTSPDCQTALRARHA